jgi:hypothetical protein
MVWTTSEPDGRNTPLLTGPATHVAGTSRDPRTLGDRPGRHTIAPEIKSAIRDASKDLSRG